LLQITDRKIGAGKPAFLIAEVAQAHDGSLGLAHNYIDATADAGADAVKFQTHIAEAESTRDNQFRINFSHQDDPRYACWKRIEFTPPQWAGLADHARERGLVFLSSAFSAEAIRILATLGIPALKTASGETSSRVLIDQMAETDRPFIVSTGLSDWREIDTIVDQIRPTVNAFALLQCTSKYPTPLSEVGLNVMDEMRTRFECPVGLSDHSGGPFPAFAALARGANIVELHITLDRRMFSPDTCASLTVPEFTQVCAFRDALEKMNAGAVDKDCVARDLAPTRQLFVRSLAPAHALDAGTTLTAEMIVPKKPGTGIPTGMIDAYIGRRLARDIPVDRLFCEEDFR
jgi:N,N'-diacetyllegionaminate synthase